MEEDPLASPARAARVVQAWWRGERASLRLAFRLQRKGGLKDFEGLSGHLRSVLRRTALRELRSTERAYVAKLALLRRHFADPLRQAAAAPRRQLTHQSSRSRLVVGQSP